MQELTLKAESDPKSNNFLATVRHIIPEASELMLYVYFHSDISYNT
jgi:hypothetical protein